MFNRLINTSPSLSVSRKSWQRDNRNNYLYRANLSKSKYQNPDYMKEVERNLQKESMDGNVTYKHLEYGKLPELSNILVSDNKESRANKLNKKNRNGIKMVEAKSNDSMKSKNK